MEKSNRKAPIVFFIGIILLCIWITSVYLIGGLYAKYSTYASGSDSVRVAFAVATASGRGDEHGLIDPAAGNSFDYTVTVSNEKDGRVSEVSLEYTIYINLPENFPTMDITVSGAELDTGNSTSTLLAFRVNNILAAGISTTNEHIVSFTGTKETIGVFSDLQVSIKVIAEQVD